MRKFVLTLIIVFFTINAFAQSVDAKPQRLETLREKLIGSFVKTFAKSYVATTNLEKFKEKNIKKILKMDEAKFQRVYQRIYKEMIVDLPESLKEEFGVTAQMTRERAIAQINSFKNKNSIYRMINEIPNKMIAQHFKNHQDEFNKGMKENRSADNVLDQLLEDPGASNT